MNEGIKLKDYRGYQIFVIHTGEFRAEVEGETVKAASLEDCEKGIQRIRDKLRKRGKVSIPCVLLVGTTEVFETTFEGIDKREKKFKFGENARESVRRSTYSETVKILPASWDPSELRALTSDVVRIRKELKEAEDRIARIPGFIAETKYGDDLDKKEELAIEYLNRPTKAKAEGGNK